MSSHTMSVKAYQCEDGKFKVDPEVKADFDSKGYILVKGLLSAEELKKIRSVLEDSDVMKEYSIDIDDGAEKKNHYCLWNEPGNDVTGMVSRSEKIAGTCEKLLEGEVMHYHSKVMMKEACVGGRLVWHQDYGYWYKNTVLFPNMITVFMPVDPCREINGCLEILEGSNRCGRITHEQVGGQLGADVERVEQVKAACPLRKVEMDPGDVLFFHCNLLHSSAQNNSPDRRWAFISAYTRGDNNVTNPAIRPKCSKLHKVPNSAILDCTVDWDVKNKAFLSKELRAAYYNDVIKKEAEKAA